jgi:hypothetical protein
MWVVACFSMRKHTAGLRKNLRRNRLKPVLVMKTAENWFGSDAMSMRKLVACRSWHRQRWPLRNPGTETRVGTTAIVMAYPFGQDLPQMSLVERNEVVERFATRRSDQSLAERVRLRDVGWSFQHAKIHGAQGVVNSGREDGVAVVHHESVRFIADQEASELLRRPLGCRVFCDVPMQNPACADLQHQENEDEPEGDRDRHEEIARRCRGGVIADKRTPRLRR